MSERFFIIHKGDLNKRLTAAAHTVVSGPFTRSEMEDLKGIHVKRNDAVLFIQADSSESAKAMTHCEACSWRDHTAAQ